ncbi:MAG: hypothetical protein SF187_15890 [Deltaproteobacteria bacterium]|nr:hypothetical protein [Deltaproteobacteria bacterium]
MIALLAVAVATAAGIVVVPSEQSLTCPSADQLAFALRTRLPQIVGEEGVGLPAPLWLRLRGVAPSLEVQLRDAQGKTVLSRDLRLQSTTVDCASLAETVSLIVERYLDELQVQRLEALRPQPAPPLAPPPLPVPATWVAGLRTLVRSGRGVWLPPGGELWLQRETSQGSWRRSGGAAAGLLRTETDVDQATFGRLEAWLLLRAAVGRVWGRHRLGIAADGGIAGVRASRRAGESSRSAWGAEPWVGLGARYRLGLGTRWFVEAAGGVYGAIVRHELVVRQVPQDTRQVVAATPRIFTDFGLGLGLQF